MVRWLLVALLATHVGGGFVDTQGWFGSEYTPARAPNSLWWADFPAYEVNNIPTWPGESPGFDQQGSPGFLAPYATPLSDQPPRRPTLVGRCQERARGGAQVVPSQDSASVSAHARLREAWPDPSRRVFGTLIHHSPSQRRAPALDLRSEPLPVAPGLG